MAVVFACANDFKQRVKDAARYRCVLRAEFDFVIARRAEPDVAI